MGNKFNLLSKDCDVACCRSLDSLIRTPPEIYVFLRVRRFGNKIKDSFPIQGQLARHQTQTGLIAFSINYRISKQPMPRRGCTTFKPS